MKPGIFYDIPQEEYFALQAANKSGLDAIDQSPLHYWARFLDPDRERFKTTPSLWLGSAIHVAVLEPKRFEREYRKEPQPKDFPSSLITLDDYKRACREIEVKVTGTKDELKQRLKESSYQFTFFDDILADAEKFKLLSESEWRKTNSIAKRVRESVAAQTILGEGKSEVTMVWTDAETGVLCKARADWLTDDGEIIIDFKSTQDASLKGFSKSCANYKYYRQAAWYLEGAEALLGKSDTRIFVFACYETDAPHAFAFYNASEKMIEQGRIENRRLLKLYADCMKKNEWPGYSDNLLSIDLPTWAQAKQVAETELETY